MVALLFFSNMVFCFILMYYYGKIKYEDGLHDGIQLNIQKLNEEDKT
jgi:hypothetical protein